MKAKLFIGAGGSVSVGGGELVDHAARSLARQAYHSTRSN